MTNKILIKKGLQTDTNNLILGEGELALAYNDDKTEVGLYAGGKNGEIIQINSDTVDNIKYTDLSDRPNIIKNPEDESGDLIDTNLTIGYRDWNYPYGSATFTSGSQNAASADNSAYSGGEYNIATARNAAGLGGNNNTVGIHDAANVGGAGNEVYGTYAANIGGFDNEVDGTCSANIGGRDNNPVGIGAITIGGRGLYALIGNTLLGHYSADTAAAAMTGINGDALIIGNGTATQTSNAFRVAYNGNVYCAGEYSSMGADYAESLEWEDGNPNNEDRRGLFAYIVGNKIRLATAEDTDRRRLSIISSRPAVVGNNYEDCWHGKYLTDEFGEVITEIVHHDAEYETVETANGDTETVCIMEECDAVEPVLNPDYDPEKKYIPRSKRPEYSFWGFTGQLIAVDDGTCSVDGYCYPSVNGIATNCDDAEKGYYVMERIDDTHILVLVR